MLSSLKTYFKFLSRNKVYTFVCVTGFAISLTFVIILGTYVKQELSVDHFHEKKDRIYVVSGGGEVWFPSPLGPYLMDNYPEVEDYCRMTYIQTFLSKGDDFYARQVLCQYADPSFFTMFSFELEEGDPATVLANPNSMVLSRSLANSMFGNEDPIGKILNFSGEDHVITGIYKDIGNDTHIYPGEAVVTYSSLAHIWELYIDAWEVANFGLYLLEREGTSLVDKSGIIKKDLDQVLWLFRDGHYETLEFIPLTDMYYSGINSEGYQFVFRVNSKNRIYTYLGIAILILAISILNYINMTTAQAGFRGREAAVRKLHGAGRDKIFRQLIYECGIITIISVSLAVLLAFLSEPLFNRVLDTKLNLAGQFTPGFIMIILACVAVISLISGIVPALTISSFQPIEIVKGTFTRRIKTGFSKVLMVFQYVATIILLVASYYIIRQTYSMGNSVPGLNHENIIIIPYGENIDHKQAVTDVLMSMPGVETVSFSQGHPYGNCDGRLFELHGKPLNFSEITADSAFFKVYGIKVFPTGIPVTDETYWVNMAGWNMLMPDSTTFTVSDGTNRMTVAGILSDFSVNSMKMPPGLIRIKRLSDDSYPWHTSIKVNPGTPINETIEAIRAQWQNPFLEILTVEDILAEWYKDEKNMSGIMVIFTILTILIMLMGLFAMSMYLIRQKQKEIAIRKVNGATVGEIMLLLNRNILLYGLIAFIIAAPAAYYIIELWLANFSTQVPVRLWPFLASGAVVILLSALSISGLSWRAARTNPVESIRNE